MEPDLPLSMQMTGYSSNRNPQQSSPYPIQFQTRRSRNEVYGNAPSFQRRLSSIKYFADHKNLTWSSYQSTLAAFQAILVSQVSLPDLQSNLPAIQPTATLMSQQ